ncbi:helix-turn-helix domain-containing protein [Streptomyces olivochromogenes]|uniref:helix-turn-helix domain-containing protein n=1 Tax=Streptomyces olivochromogenes TaxID=1963 RepID=UPI001F3E3A13|nr:helix-turn-helix transcriptional regulator [Streptomyces olivochromogenes]MCF3131249.1 helix-turn-helix transcriptional regulator [Streptomyces olivochromogenes]
MPASPSSSAQAAREAVAHRLRDLRKGAGLTVVQLAAACGWHYSKTSRIENALTGPSATDIRRWCAATHAEGQAQDLVVQSINAESMYRQWRDQVRAGLRHLQESRVKAFRETECHRLYSAGLVPGLLQTEGYALAVLGIAADVHSLPADDTAEAAHARIERSRIVHEQGHRFVVVIEESVLHYRIADPNAMAAQLGYLLTAGALPAVSLGIVPTAARRTHWPEETFHIYDGCLVSVELVPAEVSVTQPDEIAQYLETFERLRSMAVYGAEARALVLKAIDALS